MPLVGSPVVGTYGSVEFGGVLCVEVFGFNSCALVGLQIGMVGAPRRVCFPQLYREPELPGSCSGFHVDDCSSQSLPGHQTGIETASRFTSINVLLQINHWVYPSLRSTLYLQMPPAPPAHAAVGTIRYSYFWQPPATLKDGPKDRLIES